MSLTRLAGACASLATLAAVVLTGGPAFADGSSAAAATTALANPSANVTVPVDYWPACWPTTTSDACRDALLADIDYGRSLEGVGPMVLPPGFDQLDPGLQTFVVTNLERVDRGVRPIAGVTDDLSALAQTAAATSADPDFTASSVGPLAAGWWTGIWANTPNVLLADLLWMYQDGWGGSDTTNRDCTASGAAGCWGHRDNILSNYGGASQLVAGVGSSPNWGISVAEVVVGGSGTLPPLTYTWPQAATVTAVATAATAAPRATAAKRPASRHHKRKARHVRKHRHRAPARSSL